MAKLFLHILIVVFFIINIMVFARFAEEGRSPFCPNENEEPTICGTACPPTCEKPQVELCTFQCIVGCRCKNGYILRNSTKECVLPEDC
ncbi:chymotrypsin inhibitor-like [Teleopsis dalmanni]|uniref:chymotrypsin inhibitor-like n=1 Tax=Teleopsis dalmanni TaxID=139649 RepID=UPI0018CDA6DF|nr:chymotrypsin inhibitor-like [Teleopsis dalmanni]